MFGEKETRPGPADSSIVPRGYVKGKAKTGITPPLPQTEWQVSSRIPGVIEVELSPDNREFLALTLPTDTPESLADFINSLLRQERFRQGYPPHRQPQTPLNELTTQPKRITQLKNWFRKKQGD
jgi:hypothetical protein